MSHTRIYVASLSDYNNEHSHGQWIDLDGDTEQEAIENAIKALLLHSPHPNTRAACANCDGAGRDKRDGSLNCNLCAGRCWLTTAEECAVHDYEGIPATFGEHPDLDDMPQFVQGVEEHGDAFRAWVEDRGVTNFIHEDFQDKFAGEAESEPAQIEQQLEEMGTLNTIPENLRSYFDAEGYLRDMKLGGDVSLTNFDGTVYAFWS